MSSFVKVTSCGMKLILLAVQISGQIYRETSGEILRDKLECYVCKHDVYAINHIKCYDLGKRGGGAAHLARRCPFTPPGHPDKGKCSSYVMQSTEGFVLIAERSCGVMIHVEQNRTGCWTEKMRSYKNIKCVCHTNKCNNYNSFQRLVSYLWVASAFYFCLLSE